VENRPGLPNVLIYGDSISIGYTPRLREALAGKANVYRLYCNGGDSGSFIGKMDKMHQVMRNPEVAGHWTFDWDVIQVNVGLHDVKHVNERGQLDLKGKQVSSPEQYEKNLREILAYLKKNFPRAKLIFALTTAVPEQAQGRARGDAARYNEVARRVLKDYPEVAINDLYTFSLPYQVKGNVHFKKEGTQAQGDEVARFILEQLPRRE